MTNPLSGSVVALRPAIGREGIEAYAEQMNRDHPNAPVRWSTGPGTNGRGEKVQCQLKVTWKHSAQIAW